uniref:Uncharacterized protein n=1 Tax=Kalanchoe fedtschenkoi TaxID=63787 RepID=A0A7N0TPI0_KALFE
MSFFVFEAFELVVWGRGSSSHCLWQCLLTMAIFGAGQEPLLHGSSNCKFLNSIFNHDPERSRTATAQQCLAPSFQIFGRGFLMWLEYWIRNLGGVLGRP